MGLPLDLSEEESPAESEEDVSPRALQSLPRLIPDSCDLSSRHEASGSDIDEELSICGSLIFFSHPFLLLTIIHCQQISLAHLALRTTSLRPILATCKWRPLPRSNHVGDTVLRTDRLLMKIGLAGYQRVLDAFSQANLRDVLRRYQTMAQSEALRLPGPECEVDTFLARWRSETPSKLNLQFAGSVSRMWRVHKVRQASADLYELNIALDRRRLMLCNAAAWTWLTVHVVDAATLIADQLVEDRDAFCDSSDWLERLVRELFLIVRSRSTGVVSSEKFLLNVDVPPTIAHVRQNRVPLRDTTPAVTNALVQVLETWLTFPSRTQLFAAYFVIHLLHTVQNEDALLLLPVWRAHQQVLTQVLGRRGAKAAALSSQDLDPFISALQNHAIASLESPESHLLRQISSARALCIPHLQEVSSTLSQLFPSEACASSSSSTSATRRSAALPKISALPAPPQRRNPCQPTPDIATGIQSLIQFIRDAMAVVRNPSSQSFSPVQKTIASDLDYYLPMREHGCSRRKVRQSGGAFHPAIMDLPGGFASCVLTRTHLFNSRLLLELRPSSYYTSVAEWRKTLRDHGYDATDKDTVMKTLKPILNLSSYGSPQYPRYDDVDDDPALYFRQEARFHQMWAEVQANDEPALQKIPFQRFLTWTQSKVDDKKIFPLLGNLTGYLLTADFVYAERVAAPSVEELGRIIHKMQLGSLKGLIALGHPLTKQSPRDDVMKAFKHVYGALEEAFTAEEQEWMVFDPIMVEHSLCKYNRMFCTRARKK